MAGLRPRLRPTTRLLHSASLRASPGLRRFLASLCRPMVFSQTFLQIPCLRRDTILQSRVLLNGSLRKNHAADLRSSTFIEFGLEAAKTENPKLAQPARRNFSHSGPAVLLAESGAENMQGPHSHAACRWKTASANLGRKLQLFCRRARKAAKHGYVTRNSILQGRGASAKRLSTVS